jgi:competence ComEA-like helix-hairpin-helix protein
VEVNSLSIFSTLQQTFGFTRNEIKVLIFLVSTFLFGLGIRWYQGTTRTPIANPDQFDYSVSDSIFSERSKNAVDPPPGAPATMQPGKKSPLKPRSVDINTATRIQLMQLPGIGEKYADRIIRYRTERGRFHSVEELVNVSGIGTKRLERLRPYITVQ